MKRHKWRMANLNTEQAKSTEKSLPMDYSQNPGASAIEAPFTS